MKPMTITDATFKNEVTESDRLAIVDFWAEWCGPCRMVAPILEEIAGQYDGQLKITKLNVDENPQTPMAFGIRSIPTLLFFRDGKLIDTLIGYVPKPQLQSRIDHLLGVATS